MNRIKTVLLIAVVVALTASTILFVALNRQSVELELLFAKTTALPLGGWLLVAWVGGLLVGLLVALYVWLKVRVRLLSLGRELKLARRELDAYRNQPLAQAALAESDAPAAVPGEPRRMES